MYRQRFKSLEEKFWEKTLISHASDCWAWIGSRGPHGRGRMWNGEKTEMAAHIAYRLMRGPVPDGLRVLHKCDNPNCVNPKHLFLGTQQENVLDCVSKGRFRARQKPGEQHPMARLTAAQVAEIRKRVAAGEQQKALASEFAVSQTQVWKIVRGLRWKNA